MHDRIQIVAAVARQRIDAHSGDTATRLPGGEYAGCNLSGCRPQCRCREIFELVDENVCAAVGGRDQRRFVGTANKSPLGALITRPDEHQQPTAVVVHLFAIGPVELCQT